MTLIESLAPVGRRSALSAEEPKYHSMRMPRLRKAWAA